MGVNKSTTKSDRDHDIIEKAFRALKDKLSEDELVELSERLDEYLMRVRPDGLWGEKEIAIYNAQAKEDALADAEGREPRLISTVDDIDFDAKKACRKS